MTDEIEAIVEAFGVSKPIFRINLSTDKSRIDCDLVNTYRPDDGGTAVGHVACANFSENFDQGSCDFRINRHHILSETYSDIRNYVIRFIEENMGKKNAKQTKLYRWTKYEMEQTRANKETTVEIYKYICSFLGSFDNMKSYGRSVTDQQHVKNVILLLEAMMERK